MRRLLPWLAALGGVLVVGGLVLFALANSVDLGWSAYTPLEEGEPAPYVSGPLVFSDGGVLWTPQHALGAGLVVVGLLELVGLGGWVLGRRSAR